MQERKRGVLVYIIGILAFIVALASLILTVIDFVGEINAVRGDFKNLDSIILYDSIVEIVFAAIELFMGISLIRGWRKGERIEILKTVSTLIGAIVYSSFVQIIIAQIVNSVYAKSASAMHVSVVAIILYVAYYVLLSVATAYLKKNKLKHAYYSTAISATVGIVFVGYENFVVIASGEFGLESVISIVNMLIVCLVVAFALSFAVYYTKNPIMLDHDVKLNEDCEVIKRTDDHEVVKVYATRATENKVNVFMTVLYVIASVVGIAGAVCYAIEHNAQEFLGKDIGGVVDFFYGIINSGSYQDILNYVMVLIILFYPFIFISFMTGVIKRKGEYKVSVTAISSLGVVMVSISSFAFIIDVVMDVMISRSFSFENYSFWQIAMIVIYLINQITGKISKNSQKNINEGVKRGDSYHALSKQIARNVLFNGIFSIICLVVYFCMYLIEYKVLNMSYALFAFTTLLLVICTQLEVKHPYEEYSIVKRKITKEPIQEQEEPIQEQENECAQ